MKQTTEWKKQMSEQYCLECNKEIISPPPQSKNKNVEGFICPNCFFKKIEQSILIPKGWVSSKPLKECISPKKTEEEYEEIIDLGNNCHLRVKKTLKKLKRRVEL